MAEFAATVPWDRKIRRRSGKHIVKEALADYLPAGILHRPKKGFPVPWDAWLRQHFAPALEATLLDARARDRGWFNPDGVRQILDDHRSQRADYARQIWTLWGLELWARIFLDGEVPARDTGRALTLAAG
jgi:asparagine synthase (glutamine-hydrolysing)